MYNHEPKDYKCPMCKLVQGYDDEINKQDDIIYQNDKVLAYISPKWWISTPGHVIVIPKKHIENIYALC